MINDILKRYISKKYDITVTKCKLFSEMESVYRYRCDYWTNDLKYIRDRIFDVDKKEILKIIRKEKINKISLVIK